MATIGKKGIKKNQYSHQISLATVNNSYFHQEYCNEKMVMRRQWFRGVSTRKVGRRGKSKTTKENNTHTLIHTNMSETDVGCHARPPTVHNEGHSPFCSGSPTVNTILSHWASFPPPCALPTICPSFSLPSTFLSQSSLGQRSTECIEERARERERERERDKKWTEGGRERRREQICRTAWRAAWGHACHFSFHPSRLLAGAYVHKSAYCTWASAELHWVGGGRVVVHHRPQHLFSSQAICSASPGLPVGLRRTHTQCARPPTEEHGLSWGKMVDEAQQTHAHMQSILTDTPVIPNKGYLHPRGYFCSYRGFVERLWSSSTILYTKKKTNKHPHICV